MADDAYQDALEVDTRDLVSAANQHAFDPVIARDDDARAALDMLLRGRSVLLVGDPGVGKTAIVHQVATRLARGTTQFGLVQTSTTQLMARTRYLGEWESKVTAITRRAIAERKVLYMTDVWHLPDAGRSSNSNRNMLDALAPYLEQGLVLLGEAQPEQLRQMERHPLLLAQFHQQPVSALDAATVDAIVVAAAQRAQLVIDAPARRRLVELTGTYGRVRTQPGPALTMVEQVRAYLDEKRAVGEDEPVSPAFVERVFSIYSGLPLFVVSPQATKPAREIRAWFTERIVGQTEAIEAVVETIALFKAGLRDPARPIGTFLFVGPTGVGKTELARTLATFLFGSPNRLLRFDLSEFKDYHAFELLLGNPREPNRPARLVDPVRAHPFQVVLLDELEKAHQNVWDLLLPLLDEGRLTTPGGRTVDFRNTILVATSNVGAQGADRSVGFGGAVDHAERRARTIDALEREFRPEFLNRFQHVVVFHPLDEAQVRRVARQELDRILAREGITRRNLVVDVDDATLDQLIARGYDPRYGARALKRELQRRLVLPLAMTLMERAVEPGSILRARARDGHVRVTVVDTPDSRSARREAQPVEPEPGRKLDRDGVLSAAAALGPRIDAVATAVDEPHLRIERERLAELREAPAFWDDSHAAAADLRDLGRIQTTCDRLEQLREAAAELRETAEAATARAAVDRAARDLVALESAVTVAERELVRMGAAGEWDALVEVAPLGATGRAARDLVAQTLLTWARIQHRGAEILREPRADDEPVMLSVGGAWPYGLLRLEAGLHRLRTAAGQSVARVTVAPWTDARGEVVFGEHVALKVSGQLDGRVRSRLVCDGGLVLQNGRTLAANRDLALEVAPSWAAATTSDDVVRRYDAEPFLVRDVATDFTSGRREVLGAAGFHALLCRRVDALD